MSPGSTRSLRSRASSTVQSAQKTTVETTIAAAPPVAQPGAPFTDWGGTPTAETPDVLASNGKVHAEALAILNDAR